VNKAALRFQPTLKRPQHVLQNQKSKPKILVKSVAGAAAVADTGGGGGGGGAVAGGGGPAGPIIKTTLEDWTGDGDDDVNGFYASNRDNARRGGRKKRKKNKDTPPPPTNWDDIYDPSRPNSYEEYRDGDEKAREMEDWRDRVFWRRDKRADSYGSDENDGPKPIVGSIYPLQAPFEAGLTSWVKADSPRHLNTHLLRRLTRQLQSRFHHLPRMITRMFLLYHRPRLLFQLRSPMTLRARMHMQDVYG
jgi:hypothetical protein